MQIKATQCCYQCSHRLNLRYFQPITKHGEEHGYHACPTHYRDAYIRQALEDMGRGPAFDAYLQAIAPDGQGPQARGEQGAITW